MKATVIVLSHRKELVGEALLSVFLQTYPDVQVVMQYDTENFPNKLNDAASIAKGEWVCVLCDDDLLDPHYLEHCLRYADHGDVIYTDRRVFRTGQNPYEAPAFRMHGEQYPEGCALTVKMPKEAFMFGSSLPMTCLIRKTLWDELGGYDPKAPHADTELWYRMVARDARFVYVGEPLFWYRKHTGQQSAQYNSMTDALRYFHAKHFEAFGITLGPEDADGMIQGEIVPPERRVA